MMRYQKAVGSLRTGKDLGSGGVCQHLNPNHSGEIGGMWMAPTGWKGHRIQRGWKGSETRELFCGGNKFKLAAMERGNYATGFIGSRKCLTPKDTLEIEVQGGERRNKTERIGWKHHELGGGETQTV